MRQDPITDMDAICHAAIWDLYERDPDASAYRLFVRGDKKGFAAVFSIVLAAAIFPSLFASIAAIAIVTLYLSASMTRIFLAGAFCVASRRDDRPKMPARTDESLPTVSILLPLFQEPESLPVLIEALRALAYPTKKLEIFMILEEGDHATINEARRICPGAPFRLIIVPATHPQTKPKACNVALAVARGDLCVIYDAEDNPDSDQLRKAVAAFDNGSSNLACVQARLNFYNVRENRLTRLFSMEYAIWFDLMLPALHGLGAPIPLGGTSNIFKTEALRAAGGWDPFNVTEDADLGLRLHRLGHRVGMIDSTTWEEANCRTLNWLRQRSRWMKGYVQTWFVNIRRSNRQLLHRQWASILTLHLFLGGVVFMALVNPLLWAVVIYAALSDNSPSANPEVIAILDGSAIMLLLSNILYIALAALAPRIRNRDRLSWIALLTPFYWLLSSVAAYWALWELCWNPYYWAKTRHMVSAAAKQRRAMALTQ